MVNQNIQDIEAFYDYINPSTLSPLIKKEDGSQFEKAIWIKDKDEFVSRCLEYNEKYNCYSPYRQIKEKRNVDNVIFLKNFVIDIDNDVDGAKAKAFEEDYCKRYGLKIGAKAMSGGGYHYYIPYRKTIIGDENRKDMIRIANSFCQNLLNSKIEIDRAIFDLPRLIRIWGTWNFNKNQLCKLVYINQATDEEIEANTQFINSLSNLNDSKPVVTQELTTSIILPPTFPLLDYLEKTKLTKENTGKNNVLIKNIAAYLWTAQGEQGYDRGVKITQIQGKSESEFKGWWNKAQNEGFQYNHGEMYKWLKQFYPELIDLTYSLSKEKSKVIYSDGNEHFGQLKSVIRGKGKLVINKEIIKKGKIQQYISNKKEEVCIMQTYETQSKEGEINFITRFLDEQRLVNNKMTLSSELSVNFYCYTFNTDHGENYLLFSEQELEFGDYWVEGLTVKLKDDILIGNYGKTESRKTVVFCHNAAPLTRKYKSADEIFATFNYTKQQLLNYMFYHKSENKTYKEPEYINNLMLSYLFSSKKGYPMHLLINGPPGCHAKGQGIMMYDGTIKKVEDIIVGDKLMGPDSSERNVLKLIRGKDKMVKIIPIKGEPFIVNENHVLSLKLSGKDFKNPIVNISVKDYFKLPKYIREKAKLYRVGVEYKNSIQKIPPYILGTWLGDGTSSKTEITSNDVEIVDEWKKYASGIGLFLDKYKQYKYTITSRKKIKGINLFMNNLKSYNLINNKHIPKDYLLSSRQNRLDLLAGIIDTDGHVRKNTIDIVFGNKSRKLAKDVVFLAKSLGFGVTYNERYKRLNYKNNEKYLCCCISISGFDQEDIPTKITRKKINPRKQIKNTLVTGFRIEQQNIDNFYGFTVDKDNLYLIDDFTVCHNCGKSSMIEAISEKFDESNLDSGGASTIKNLVPSFGQSPPRYGSLLSATRLCFVDEFFGNIHNETKGGSGGSQGSDNLRIMNEILEARERRYGSGKGVIEKARMKAKLLCVTNPIEGTTFEETIQKTPETVIQRILVINLGKAMDEWVNNSITYVDGPIEPFPDIYVWLGIYDFFNSFLSKYDTTRVLGIIKKYEQKVPVYMRSIYNTRYKNHHIHLLLDGIVKTRCLFEKDAAFTATDRDYFELERLWDSIIAGWNEYVTITTFEQDFILEVVKNGNGELTDHQIKEECEKRNVDFDYNVKVLKERLMLEKKDNKYKLGSGNDEISIGAFK